MHSSKKPTQESLKQKQALFFLNPCLSRAPAAQIYMVSTWKPTTDSKFQPCPNPLQRWGRGSKSRCTVMGSCKEQRGWAGEGDRHPQLQFSLRSLAGFQNSRDIREKPLNSRVLLGKPGESLLPQDSFPRSLVASKPALSPRSAPRRQRCCCETTPRHLLPHKHFKAACHKKQDTGGGFQDFLK